MLFFVVVLVVGPISTASMKAYCTLTPQWSSVIHLQRRCTPSGVRDLCYRRTELRTGNFSQQSVIHEITSFFYMPQSWDMGHIFYFPSEGRHA
jgi:hypothetical protein